MAYRQNRLEKHGVTDPKMPHLITVLVQAPAHSRIPSALSYACNSSPEPGTLVRVPLGRREVLGVVWTAAPDSGSDDSKAPEQLRHVSAVLDSLPALDANWRSLVSFTARYYHRSVGEVAHAALPTALRTADTGQITRRIAKVAAAAPKTVPQAATPQMAPARSSSPPGWVLSAAQQSAIDAIHAQAGPFLLFGATGSGKTEVYLHCAEQLLREDPKAQVLIMVPEINLTPQLERQFSERFAPQFGERAVQALHSGMTPVQRLNSWLQAHLGHTRILLGTRMAVFASMPQLRLIVVDEEQDPSYKSQDGARHSARDLAIYRAQTAGAKIILGSATPSLESWHHSRAPEQGGRYLRLTMAERIGSDPGAAAESNGLLPRVRTVDMNQQPKASVIAPPLVQAISERVARGEQSLLLLNRRGYAPVLQCQDCDWKSECPYCSAYRVFHKIDRTLRCHHCGLIERVPRYCPDCGNQDITPIGRGTERLEENLATLLANVRRPDGAPVAIARIDADTTRLKGSLEAQLAQVHHGHVDVLVGTQMIAKGHDFRRITLVAAVNPDSALFSADFRAPERLFGLLMQAAGRAGRDARLGHMSEMWVQTRYPRHDLFEALRRHDYPAFAQSQLLERQRAGMPPWTAQALVRAEARTQEVAQAFLEAARHSGLQLSPVKDAGPGITLYPVVPMTLQRVANIERAQMLVESDSRATLLRFLSAWHEVMHRSQTLSAHKGLIRWAVDVDPLSI